MLESSSTNHTGREFFPQLGARCPLESVFLSSTFPGKIYLTVANKSWRSRRRDSRARRARFQESPLPSSPRRLRRWTCDDPPPGTCKYLSQKGGPLGVGLRAPFIKRGKEDTRVKSRYPFLGRLIGFGNPTSCGVQRLEEVFLISSFFSCFSFLSFLSFLLA